MVVVELLKAEYKIRSQLENVYTRLKIVSRRNLANVFHCFLHKTFQEYLAAAYIPAPEKGEDVDTLAQGSPDLWVDANNELNVFNIFKAPNRVEDNMRLVAGRKPDLLRGNDEVNVIEMFKTLEKGEDVITLVEGSPGIGKTTFCLKLAYYWAPKDDSVLKKTFEMEILALGELAWKCLLSEIELEEKMPGIGISCPWPSLQGRKSKEIKTLTRVLLSSQDLPRVLGCRVHCREVNQQFNWLVRGRKPDLLRGNDEVNVIEMFKTLEKGEDVITLVEGSPGIGKTTFCLKLAYYWAPKDDSVLKKTFEMEILALGELAWKCLLSEIELEEKMPGIGISCPWPSLQGRKSKEIKTLTRVLLSSQDLPRVLGCRVHCREVNQQFNWLVRGRKPDLLRGNDEVNVIEMFKTLEKGEDVITLVEGSPGIGKTTFCLKLAYYWAPKDDSVLKKTFEMEILALGELAWKCLLSEIELEEKMRAIGIPCPRTSLRGRKSKEIKTSTRVLLSSQDLPRVLGCRVHCREVNQQFNRLVRGRKPDLLGGNDEVNVIEIFKTLEKVEMFSGLSKEFQESVKLRFALTLLITGLLKMTLP